MRRWLLTAALCSLAACGDDPPPPADSGAPDVGDAAPSDITSPDVAPDVTPDAAPDAGRPVPCLDRPTELPRPPANVLPCELIPPGF